MPAHVERTSARRTVTDLLAAWWRCGFTLDARGLAAFRIALGLILVVDCLLRFRSVSAMFSPDGAFPPDLLRDYLGTPAAWSLALFGDATWCGATVLAAEGLAGAWLATGVGSRAATVAAWVATVSVVQRTAPTANAGDYLLVCLLFWSMFLPLGAAWTAGRRRTAPGAVLSVASAALVLQVAAVYFGAGLAKLNAQWLSGTALSYALSVHDHGNSWGMALAGQPWLTRPATWGVLALELCGPLIAVLVPRRTVRGVVVAVFMIFHAAVFATMWVGIFAPVGIAAWLPMVPESFWDAATGRRREPGVGSLGFGGSLACGIAGALAATSFIHQGGCPEERPLPTAIRTAIAAVALEQRWNMFGTIPVQEQWVYGEALLDDGRVVDLLRRGRPLERDRPGGGFTSLDSHRWHKLFWNLAREDGRTFATPTAAALVRQWNARHADGPQVESLELRFAMRRETPAGTTVQDILLAAWPARGAAGHGNLERFLESADAGRPVTTTGR